MIHNGDCLEVMATMEDESFDAVVTDPPAGIGFMGKSWDHHRGGRDQWVAWMTVVMRECLRVLKPGGYALVWALPRTSYWTAWALDDAGFEVRDRLAHVFASGFPKSHNLPGGLGTALKPAVEDWWLARKPLAGTVASNVTRYGTGALNIDATRIATDEDQSRQRYPVEGPVAFGKGYEMGGNGHAAGRWPPNLLLSDAELFDVRNDGVVGSGATVQGAVSNGSSGASQPYMGGWKGQEQHATYGDTGGYARFFLVPKASRSDREPVWGEELDVVETHVAPGSVDPERPTRLTRRNTHPTTKPVDLMRHLVRLVTPPGGRILDPFLGSGTTAIAAIMEGFECVGIEREAEYVAIAEARLNGVQTGIGL